MQLNKCEVWMPECEEEQEAHKESDGDDIVALLCEEWIPEELVVWMNQLRKRRGRKKDDDDEIATGMKNEYLSSS